MLSSATQSDTQDAGNIQPERLDTNQQTTPLAYWFGRRWFALTWIVREPKNVSVTKSGGGGKSAAKSGSGSASIYRCDVAGVVNGIGQVDFIEAIRVNGKIVWAEGGGISRDASHPEHTGNIVVPNVGTFRLHWGTPTAAGDFLILNSIGEEHPYYRDMPILEAKQLQQSSGGSVVNVEVLLERAPQFSGLPSDRTGAGGSPITGLAEYLANSFYGHGLAGVVHVASAAAEAEDLLAQTQTVVVAGSAQEVSLGRLSCYLAERSTFGNFLAGVLEHFDGWVRRRGDQLEFGRFTHGNIDTSALLELTLHDFTEDPHFASPGYDDASVYTDAIVKGPDREWDMQDTPQIARNDAARARLGEIRIKTYDRPFAITAAQHQLLANELAKFYATPAGRDTVSVRREKCAGLLPGDRCIINYGPSAKREVYRVRARRDPARGGVVELELELERLLGPLSYVSPPNPAPTLPVPPVPQVVAHARLLQLPPAWAAGPEPVVIPLVQRPSAATLGCKVWFSTADATYDELATITDFALRGTLSGAITVGATSLVINATGYDVVATLEEQSAAAQLDDTLLLFIGAEVLSIGSVTALGGGLYQLGVLRGRLGSAAAAQADGLEVYALRRAVAEELRHADFPRSASIRYFKFPTFTADETQELADALKLSFTFADTGVGAPTSVGVVGGVGLVTLALTLPAIAADLATLEIWERSALTPAPVDGDTPDFTAPAVTTSGGRMAYVRSGLGASVTRYYWLRLRDTIAGKSSIVYAGVATTSATLATADDNAATNALIAQITGDLANLVNVAQDQAAAVLTEIKTRITSVAAEASARQTAITTEQNLRQQGDDQLAQTITNLTATVTTQGNTLASHSTSIGTINQTLSTQATTNTSVAQSITNLTASVGAINTSLAGLTTSQTATATNVDSLVRDLAGLFAMFNDSSAAIGRELKVRADADTSAASLITALTSTVGGHTTSIATINSTLSTQATTNSSVASSITTLTSSVNSLSSTVSLLASAYVVGGQAVATWGLRLDANGKVVSMQAIAASGGTQGEVGVIAFGGCNLQSSNFQQGSSGWRMTYSGVLEAGSAIIRDSLVVNLEAAPSLDPVPQTFSTSLTVYAAASGSATVRYTTNGRPVDSGSAVFPGGGLSITDTTVLRVRAYTSTRSSDETIAIYTKTSALATQKVATPAIGAAVLGSGGYRITISCATSGAQIYFGVGAINSASEPSYSTYSGYFDIAVGTTYSDWKNVWTYATKSGLTTSDKETYQFDGYGGSAPA